LLNQLTFKDSLENFKEQLEHWNQKLDPTSVEAGIYVAWEDEIKKEAHKKFIPEKVKKHLKSLQLKRILDWVRKPRK